MSDLLAQLTNSAPAQALQARLARVRDLPPTHLGALCSVLALAAWRLVSRRSTRRRQRAAWRDWSAVVAVVTGGSSGIGHEVVQQLRARGARVVILDLQPPKEAQDGVLFLKTDVTDFDSVQQTRAAVHKHFGPVTVLVNNAGVGEAGANFMTASAARLRLTVEVNLLSSFHTVKTFLPDMLTANKGHVVTIASAASFLQAPRAIDYSVSKAGVLSFHEGLRHEIALLYRRPGVLTTIVHPSWVRTPMTDHLFRPEVAKKFLSPRDVAEGVAAQLDRGASGEVYLPGYVRILPFLRSFTHGLQDTLRLALSRGVIADLKPELAAEMDKQATW